MSDRETLRGLSEEEVLSRFNQQQESIDVLDKEDKEEIEARAKYYEKTLTGLRDAVNMGRVSAEKARKDTAQALALEEYRRARDPLTNLLTRREFDKRLGEEIASAKRSGIGMGLILLDTDEFRDINNALGHPAGDQVLRVIAQTLKRETRPGDIPVRYGGDEFAVILPRVDEKGLSSFNERIKEIIEEELLVTKEEIHWSKSITVTTGFAIFNPKKITGNLLEKLEPKKIATDLLEEADKDLRTNKGYENLTNDL